MQEVRDAWRALRASPLVVAVAVLTLALGIGANTAVFWILDSLLLKPLPVRDPHRLALIGSADGAEVNVSYPVWEEIRRRRIFDQAFAWGTDRVDLAESGESAFADAIWASGDFFEVLGVLAISGRTFDGRDDRRGGGPEGPVAVISHRLWRLRFGGDAAAVGRTLTIDRVPFTIVGVSPPGFFGPEVGAAFDIVLPLEAEPLIGRSPGRLDNRFWPWLRVMARLGPGRTAEEVTGTLRAAQPEIRKATMPGFSRVEDRDAYLRQALVARAASGGSSQLRDRYGPALLVLLGLVGLVLLVACANLANLLLARVMARRYELSVRLALGASRLRLLRQLLAESVLLSAIGATLGLVLAYWGSQLLVRQLSTWAYTASLDLSLDWRVLGFTGGAAIATAVLFGSLPALSATRAEPVDALREHVRLAGHRGAGFGGLIVVVQVAVSLVLVVGAGLFARSFAALAYRDLGFDRERVLVAIIEARRSAVPPAGRAGLYERLREAAAVVPGVESAAASMATPIGIVGNLRWTPTIQVPGGAAPPDGEERVLANRVSPDWFRTFGTRLLAGRDFNTRDRPGAVPVTIVNQAFARRFFGGANPLGRAVVLVDGTDRRPLEIVGLVANAAYTSVREPVKPTLYAPLAQITEEKLFESFPFINISVRAAQGPPDRLAGSLASAIGRVDRDLSITFRRVSEQLNVFYVRERLLAMLSGFFGVLALLLAALGLYGVTAHAVMSRRREIGVRVALGARPSAVMRLVFRRVAALAGLGILVGGIAAFWAVRFLRTLLFGVPPRDTQTFLAAAVVLGAVAAAAGFLPARRAARIDPAAVLREG